VKAIENFEVAIALAQKGKFTRLLADAQFYLEDIYRKRVIYRRQNSWQPPQRNRRGAAVTSICSHFGYKLWPSCKLARANIAMPAQLMTARPTSWT